MGVRVYVSLKKDNKELAKYPLCVSVFVNDCELADRKFLEDGFEICGIDGGDIVDTQTLVLSVPNNSNYMNCDIITNTKHKVVLEDQVYKDKETLKVVMTQYTIEHRFQWRTDISSQTCLSKVFYGMVKAYKQSEFYELIEKVEQVDVRVKNYLESAGHEKWAKVYATVDRGFVMTSNIVECINACLVEARELPIYNFLEEVR
ncbi:hypothetical protein KY285_029763 [Solanum tuberosum]|nr:hypothetical protein KY285_029763 [Solanum tuberosum]